MFPGIAVGEALRARGHEVMLLISEKNVDSEASAKYTHLQFKTVPAVAKPPTLSPRMLSETRMRHSGLVLAISRLAMRLSAFADGT